MVRVCPKNVLIVGWLLLLVPAYTQQAVDLTQKPAPGPVVQVRFPDFTEFHLSNGLTVFVIEDHEQPTVTFRVQIAAGSIADPEDKAGAMEMLVDMLSKGTQRRSALAIAQALDTIGASLNTSAGGDGLYLVVSGLKKYSQHLLDILSDLLQNPTFPPEELAKYKQQVIAGLRYEKSQPFEVANKLARKVIYGEHHPYARRPTEQSVERITAEDLQTLHQRYIVPALTSIAVVGDVTPPEVRQWMEQFFGRWQATGHPELSVPEPAVAPAGVYFVERSGSVQSTIVTTAPAVPYSHPDYEKLMLAAEMLGSGFGGWFFRTLRETYGYTYTPFAFLTRAKYANRFVGAADVRNAVTDSALTVMLEQIQRLGTEGPTEQELFRIKRQRVGSYLMNFESSAFIASLIQRADLFGESIEHLKDFPRRYMSYTPDDVKAVAQQYLHRDQLRFVVVGDPSVLPKLEPFGPVYRYDLDLQPIPADTDTVAGETVSFSLSEVLDRYEQAVGGRAALERIRTLRSSGTLEMRSGPQTLTGTVAAEIKRPDKGHFKTSLLGRVHEIWVSGGRVWEMAMGNSIEEKQGAEAEESLRDVLLFPLLEIQDLGYTLQVDGLRNGLIAVKALSPAGKEVRYYLDPETYLLVKTERFIEGPMGQNTLLTEEIVEYITVDGVQLPKVIRLTVGPITITQTITEYEVNIPLEDHRFIPPSSSGSSE